MVSDAENYYFPKEMYSADSAPGLTSERTAKPSTGGSGQRVRKNNMTSASLSSGIRLPSVSTGHHQSAILSPPLNVDYTISAPNIAEYVHDEDVDNPLGSDDVSYFMEVRMSLSVTLGVH